MITGILKRGFEKGLVHTGAVNLVRRLGPIDTVILAYHNIVPEGNSDCGERSLHLPLREFNRHLDLLQKNYRVVTLDTVPAPPVSDDRPRAVITFDDAYRGALTIGLAQVVRRGLPATIFASPANLGGRTFWWDELADPATGVLAAEVRRDALEECTGQEEILWRRLGDANSARRAIPSHARSVSLDELRSAATQPGIALASHTWGHANLTRLPDAPLARELSEGLAWLRERFENVIPWLSYPYGLTSLRVQRAAAAAGYQGAVLVNGGVVRNRQKLDLYAVPRVNVPAGLSLEGFKLRMAGLGAS